MLGMTRREFITLLGGSALSWPFSASGQPADRSARVGFFGADRSAPLGAAIYQAFLDELQIHGFRNGQNLIVDYRRVEQQFEQGLLDEIRGLLLKGVPEGARPFGGLVYRQALEHLHGVRDEPSTRALIAQENRRYARRQLIWFRKEPNLRWFDGPGESIATIDAVSRFLDLRLLGAGDEASLCSHGSS